MGEFFDGEPGSNPVGNGRGLSPEQQVQLDGIAARIDRGEEVASVETFRERLNKVAEGLGEQPGTEHVPYEYMPAPKTDGDYCARPVDKDEAAIASRVQRELDAGVDLMRIEVLDGIVFVDGVPVE